MLACFWEEPMKVASFCLLFAFVASSPVLAQTKNPVSDVARQILASRQKNMIDAVDEMPADKFSYKPTPQQVTFAHLVAHMVGSNNELCAKAADIAPPRVKPVNENDPKDKLLAALKDSFTFCNSALAKANDSKLGETIDLYGGHQGPRAFAFFALTNDWADHYSTAAMYLRLNGMLPPTAKK
jgi:hypothetical protein